MKKRTPPTRTYQLTLTGELEGFTVTMRGMSAADLIAMQGGDLSNAEALELAINHIADSNFDVTDYHQLDWWIVLEILGAWTEAMKDAALPPVIATS